MSVLQYYTRTKNQNLSHSLKVNNFEMKWNTCKKWKSLFQNNNLKQTCTVKLNHSWSVKIFYDWNVYKRRNYVRCDAAARRIKRQEYDLHTLRYNFIHKLVFKIIDLKLIYVELS